jgi:3-dehydroquinate synthase
MKQIIMQIPAQPAVSYPINIGTNLLAHPEQWLPMDWRNKQLVIMTDNTVNALYGKKIFNVLKEWKPLLLSFAPGEKSKNYQTKRRLEEKMIRNHCNRETIILSLGGGVVGDIAGFIAATYMRGIAYIQLPTTLLAMVDSSIGGKTSINTAQGKNLIGAFWQPTSVIIDMNCLATLPQTHMINGLIEALKMFMTMHRDYFDYAHDNIDSILSKDVSVLQNIIERAIKIKIDVVSADEKENHQRAILNFGHTIGHALEKVTRYTLLHGYAVALGILVEAKISQLLGFISLDDYQMIQSLFLKLTISGDQLKEINHDAIIKATKIDKKIKDNQVRYVLLKKIGQVYSEDNVFTHPVPDEIVAQSLFDVSERENGRQ